MSRYLVICERSDGLFAPERSWAAMDMDTTKRDLSAGHFARPIIILSIDVICGTCTDVTDQFQRYIPAPHAR